MKSYSLLYKCLLPIIKNLFSRNSYLCPIGNFTRPKLTVLFSHLKEVLEAGLCALSSRSRQVNQGQPIPKTGCWHVDVNILPVVE
jgi:hypothetical protein